MVHRPYNPTGLITRTYLIHINKDTKRNRGETTQTQVEQKGTKTRFRCAKPGHFAKECTAKNIQCKFCKQMGHVSAVCFRKRKSSQNQVDQTFEDDNYNEESEETEEVYTISTVKKLDSSFSSKYLSTISLQKFRKICPKIPIQDTTVRLKTYTGEEIKPIGKCAVEVNYKNQSTVHTLYVLGEDVDTILGREWFQNLKFDWKNINRLGVDGSRGYNKNLDSLI